MILDHTDNLSTVLDEKDPETYLEIMALNRLAEGMFWLYEKVLRLENRVKRAANRKKTPDGKVIYAGFLSDFVPKENLGFLSSAFHYYAVSACSYAQLAGWLSYKNTNDAKKYMVRVLPRLSLFRNKVAAHFAKTDPRKSDTMADLTASVMTQIVYSQGYLMAGALTLERETSNLSELPSKDYSWSLTLAREQLKERYWPNEKPRSIESIPIAAKSTVKAQFSWSVLDEKVKT